MSSVDLALRYLIIAVAWHLACAWVQTFQSPYPIVDAFELAETAEDQLFKSLGISWPRLCVSTSMSVIEGCAVCLDEPLRRFATAFLACGSSISAIELTPPIWWISSPMMPHFAAALPRARKFMTRDTMASFSSGRDSAIMMVVATSESSPTVLRPFSYSNPLRSRK